MARSSSLGTSREIRRRHRHVRQSVLSGLGDPDQFVEFYLDGFTLSVLGIANKEYHQEGGDVGDGVDDKERGVHVLEPRAGQPPTQILAQPT